MEYEHFGPSRDLLYLCFLFAGCALGSCLMILRRSCTIHARSRWIAAALCLVSLALAALAGSIILSRGAVLTVRPLYPVAALFFALGTILMRFPRFGGCTIIFFTGLFAVWLCISFFAFPAFDEPLRLTIRASGEGDMAIRQNIAAGTRMQRRRGESEAETWYIPKGPMTFEAASVTAKDAYPFIGGKCRGIIMRTTRNGEELFVFEKSLYRFRYGGGLGFILNRYTLELPAEAVLPGVNITVLFNGQKLYFDPPIRL